jgi:hypothetical protein
MAKPVNGQIKKPYSPPVLTVYGTVRELTQHSGAKGSADHPPAGLRSKTAL